MQKVIEYSDMNFWSSSISPEKLNGKIAELNREGWKVISITPKYGFGRVPRSYMLLLDRDTR